MKTVYVDSEQTGTSLAEHDTWEIALIVSGSKNEDENGEWLFQIGIDTSSLSDNFRKDLNFDARYQLKDKPINSVLVIRSPGEKYVPSNKRIIRDLFAGSKVVTVNPTYEYERLHKAIPRLHLPTNPTDLVDLLVGYTVADYGYPANRDEELARFELLGFTPYKATNDLLADLRHIQEVHLAIINRKPLKTPEQQEAEAQERLEANKELHTLLTKAASKGREGTVPRSPRRDKKAAKDDSTTQ